MRGRIGAGTASRPYAPGPAITSESWLEPLLVDYFSRDGSTLLMRLLSTSPQISVEMTYPYERKYFGYLWRWAHLLDREDWPEADWGPGSLGSLGRLQAPDAALVGPPPWLPRPLLDDPDGLQPMSQRAFELAWREFSRRAAAATRAEHASPEGSPPVRYFAEKHLNTWKVDLATLPPLKLLALLRDPRDSWVSINSFNEMRGSERLGRDRAGSAEQHLENLIRRQRERLRWIAGLLEAGEVPVVRYDELVLDTAGVAERLGDWLGVSLDAEAASEDRALSSRHVSAGSPAESVGRWRSELDEATVARFESDLGPELRAVGLGS